MPSAQRLDGTTAQRLDGGGWDVEVVGGSALGAQRLDVESEVVVQDGRTWTVVRLEG